MLAAMPSALFSLALASLVASSPVPEAAMPSRALQATDAPMVRELEFNGLRDGLITGVGAALWISSETVLKSRLAPSTCRWCDRSPDGQDTLNAVDRWGRGLGAGSEAGRKTWDTASNVAGFFALPVGVLGGQYLLSAANGAPVRYWAEDAVMIVETTVVSTVVNQAVKFVVGRERPFIHALSEEQKGLITEHKADKNLSFYSGHTNAAFSLVAAAGTVSHLRGYRHSWVIWAVGIPAAASVGLMRMGADKHYLTDVAVGAVAGTVFGVGLPLLMHGRMTNKMGASAADLSMRVSGAPGGFSLSGQF